MLRYTVLFCILCSVSGFSFKRPDPKCDESDLKCIGQVARDLISSSLTRIEELDTESLDPLHQEKLKINLPESEFFLINTTTTGWKDIIIDEVMFIENKTQKTLRYDMTLPHYEMTGNYYYNGKFNNMVVEGDGYYEYKTTNIHLLVDALKVYYKKDGKTYMKLTNIRAKVNVLGSKDLKRHSGSKEFSETILKFMNENPEFITTLWQDVVNLSTLNRLFDNINKILETVAVAELVTEEHII